MASYNENIINFGVEEANRMLLCAVDSLRRCPDCGDDDRHEPDCPRNYKNIPKPKE